MRSKTVFGSLLLVALVSAGTMAQQAAPGGSSQTPRAEPAYPASSRSRATERPAGATPSKSGPATILVRIVHISFLSSRAVVEGAQGQPVGWSQALLNAPVVEGESIRTLRDGELEVQLECGSALRLAPQSEFSFPQLSRLPDGVTATTVAVESGTAFFSMRHLDSRDFQVRIPDAAAATVIPDGAAEFRVDVAAAGPTSVQVSGGHAEVRVGNTSFKLKKNSHLVWSASAAPHLVQAAPPDQWTRWNRRRDDAFGRSLMASVPPSEFAGADLESLPGSVSNSRNLPEWDIDGLVPPVTNGNRPSSMGNRQSTAVSDLPTSPLVISTPIPACARD